MRPFPRARFAVLLLPLVLAACATVSAPDFGLARLDGRLALRIDSQPPQSMSAAFELLGDGERGRLVLTNPLGLQIAQAHWSPGAPARLITSDGERQFGDLDSLAEGALGERVPLAALPDWLRGRPWPKAPSQAAASGFEQLGWSIDLGRQAEGRVALRRVAAPAVDLRVQLDSR